jgi:hypothetical protein
MTKIGLRIVLAGGFLLMVGLSVQDGYLGEGRPKERSGPFQHQLYVHHLDLLKLTEKPLTVYVSDSDMRLRWTMFGIGGALILLGLAFYCRGTD